MSHAIFRFDSLCFRGCGWSLYVAEGSSFFGRSPCNHVLPSCSSLFAGRPMGFRLNWEQSRRSLERKENERIIRDPRDEQNRNHIFSHARKKYFGFESGSGTFSFHAHITRDAMVDLECLDVGSTHLPRSLNLVRTILTGLHGNHLG